MVPCSACGMATDATDDANGIGHPMCRIVVYFFAFLIYALERLSPSGARWCPLCAVAVDDNKEAWKTHLSKQCYNNPRKNGPDLEVDTAPRIPEKTRPNSSASTKAVSGARLIDADKLVAALQEVQLRKKQESKKKTPATDKEEPATAATK
ncbi:unnamed protein product [Cylicostephanus goldi]|uniref:Uncharacterized protein n=1 Tax=Cylicostephanus goldi TaxID=71465 RepID=A0A3P6RRN6_CYLGO|nr:unnamed protein product [Cylicostephanus goldi]